MIARQCARYRRHGRAKSASFRVRLSWIPADIPPDLVKYVRSPLDSHRDIRLFCIKSEVTTRRDFYIRAPSSRVLFSIVVVLSGIEQPLDKIAALIAPPVVDLEGNILRVLARSKTP